MGQNKLEEINSVPATALGANFGWSFQEGSTRFKGTTDEVLTDPIHEWSNVGGSAAIGGVVYRGRAIPALQGLYLFADLAQRGLFALDPADGSVIGLELPIESVVGFGVDSAGEVYVLSFSSGVSRVVARR